MCRAAAGVGASRGTAALLNGSSAERASTGTSTLPASESAARRRRRRHSGAAAGAARARARVDPYRTQVTTPRASEGRRGTHGGAGPVHYELDAHAP